MCEPCRPAFSLSAPGGQYKSPLSNSNAVVWMWGHLSALLRLWLGVGLKRCSVHPVHSATCVMADAEQRSRWPRATAILTILKIYFVFQLHLRDVYAASMITHTLLVKWMFWYSAYAPMCTAVWRKSWHTHTHTHPRVPWSNVHQNKLLQLCGRQLWRWGGGTEAGNRDDSGREPVGVCQRCPRIKEERRWKCDGVWAHLGSKENGWVGTVGVFQNAVSWPGGKRWRGKEGKRGEVMYWGKNKQSVNERKREARPSSFNLLGYADHPRPRILT